MRISIYELADRQRVLAGTAAGKRLLMGLVNATPTAPAPETLFLDFGDIDVMTASFLRDGIIAYRDFARGSFENIYPVIANAKPAVREELEFFVAQRKDVLWRCDLDDADLTINVGLIGELDPAQHTTFEMVRRLGRATAPDLAAQSTNQAIGPTAWNNRLSALSQKGLVVERRDGKTKSFTPLFMESV